MLLGEVGGDFDVTETLRGLQEEMVEASNNLAFEKAALLRDQIRELKRQFGETPPESSPREVSYRQTKRGKKQRLKPV
jgi:excinuclease ABC subunit B